MAAIPTRTLHELAEGVWVWLQPGGESGVSNAGVIADDDGLTVVDTLMVRSQWQPFADAVARLGRPVRRVVLTHAHVDHVGGTKAFPMASVLGSPQTSQLLDGEMPVGAYKAFMPAFTAEFDDLAELGTRPVTHLVTDAAVLTERIELLPATGHTSGDVMALVSDVDVLFAGDLCFFGVTPLASSVWTTGQEFGTIGARINGVMCEITTYRADRYDRVSRNPLVAYGDSLADDLRRRDFTMNAMALSVTGDRTFTDPFGGLGDLVKYVLRTPASPQDSFADDPLRMLRAARFVATLGMVPTGEVIAAMTELAPQLGRITAERVQVELSKLLLGPDPRTGIELLVDTGLADVVLPEIPALQMADDEHGQHKDVYAHTLQVLEQAIDLEDDGPDLVLRMAALLHDIGKPATREFQPGGRVSFHHHEVVGRTMARKRLRELRYSKQFVEDVTRLVFLHLRFYGYRDGDWTDSAVRRYVVDAGPLLPRLHKLVRSDCTTRNKRKAAMLSAAYDSLEQRIAELQEREQLDAIRPDLDGNEIMKILGIGPGPTVGQAWSFLKQLRMDEGPLEHDRAVAELKRWWAQAQGG